MLRIWSYDTLDNRIVETATTRPALAGHFPAQFWIQLTYYLIVSGGTEFMTSLSKNFGQSKEILKIINVGAGTNYSGARSSVSQALGVLRRSNSE